MTAPLVCVYSLDKQPPLRHVFCRRYCQNATATATATAAATVTDTATATAAAATAPEVYCHRQRFIDIIPFLMNNLSEALEQSK